VQYQKDK